MDSFLQHFQSVIVALEQWNGLDHVHLLVSHETGRAMTLSVWADKESMEASEAGADEMRDRVTDLTGVRTDSVERFELARTIRGPASKGLLPFAAAGP
jgi:heme-degrading monooxygenase HmoA